MTEKTDPQIEILIEREDRMKAISALARAVEALAKALNAQPQVTISGCSIASAETGISIDTQEPTMQKSVWTRSEETE